MKAHIGRYHLVYSRMDWTLSETGLPSNLRPAAGSRQQAKPARSPFSSRPPVLPNTWQWSAASDQLRQHSQYVLGWTSSVAVKAVLVSVFPVHVATPAQKQPGGRQGWCCYRPKPHKDSWS